MILAACDVAFTTSGGGVVSCPGTLSMLDTSTLLTQFDLSQLDPAVIASAFGAGFVLMATAVVVGKAVSTLLNFIKGGRS